MELAISEPRMWATNIKTWFVRTLNRMIEARQKEANRRIAMMQLHSMTDRELNDIGLGRADIKRVVYDL
jgi:uncharacterized protein YjiS (DUF1127 family)